MFSNSVRLCNIEVAPNVCIPTNGWDWKRLARFSLTFIRDNFHCKRVSCFRRVRSIRVHFRAPSESVARSTTSRRRRRRATDRRGPPEKRSGVKPAQSSNNSRFCGDDRRTRARTCIMFDRPRRRRDRLNTSQRWNRPIPRVLSIIYCLWNGPKSPKRVSPLIVAASRVIYVC